MKLKGLDLNKLYTYADYLTWRPPFHKEDKISPMLFPRLVIGLQDIFPEKNLAEEPWDEHYIRM